MSVCMACKYWSELVAKAEGAHVVALCLNTESPNHSKYTGPKATCPGFAAGPPIDEPIKPRGR